MCLTAPVRVVAVDEGRAEVDLGGRRYAASTLLVPDVRPGDWALLSAGVLVRRIEPELAAELAAAVSTVSGEPS